LLRITEILKTVARQQTLTTLTCYQNTNFFI